jgi:glutathione S-transferase
MYWLFSWEHSYFSGKARAYLRAPDGTWVQDTSEIIDYVEAAHRKQPVVPDAATSPRQCLASYLIELLADEWVLVPAFWQRWFYSEDGREPSHRAFNEAQWGAVLATGAPGPMRRAAGAGFFETMFGISTSRSDPKGTYAGLVHLGVDEKTEHAWQASQHRLLERLEAHFGAHDYVLGGQPSLADFGLMGPLYAHLYRDAVPGFALRTWFPLVAEWVERTNAEGALNARWYGQKLYSLDPKSGELVGRPATSDAGAWLPDDVLPDTLRPVLAVFFEEMWPVLRDAAAVLTEFIASDAHEPGGELPGKSFTATPEFLALQTEGGPLTHEYRIGDVSGRRMVIPYQIWMLGRVARVLADCTADAAGRTAIEELLAGFAGGPELLELDRLLAGCRLHKVGGRLFSSVESRG